MINDDGCEEIREMKNIVFVGSETQLSNPHGYNLMNAGDLDQRFEPENIDEIKSLGYVVALDVEVQEECELAIRASAFLDSFGATGCIAKKCEWSDDQRFLVHDSAPPFEFASRFLREDLSDHELHQVIKHLAIAAANPSSLHEVRAERVAKICKKLGYSLSARSFMKTIKKEAQFYPDLSHITTDDSPYRAELSGMHMRTDTGDSQLCDFSVKVMTEISRNDGDETDVVYELQIIHCGKFIERFISSSAYSDDRQFRTFLYATIGPTIIINSSLNEIRNCIAAVSYPEKKQVTTDFGWSPDGKMYLTPTGIITDGNWVPIQEYESAPVDLTDIDQACELKLKEPERSVVAKAKRIIAHNLTRLADQNVVCILLAFLAVTLLQRFSGIREKFCLWLCGESGRGKSFIARLIQRFFGEFLLHGTVGTFTSTINSLELISYYFKDAIRLIDDFKPDIVRPAAWIRLLQSYADGGGRSRLNADSTTKQSKPIRGHLLITGESAPDQSSSALARTVVVQLPAGDKDIALGKQLEADAKIFPAFTSALVAFIQVGEIAHPAIPNGKGLVRDHHHLIVQDTMISFYELIKGRENDVRIAGNFALLSAGFYVLTSFMADVWENVDDLRSRFDSYLRQLCVTTANAVNEEAPVEVFLSCLQDLLSAGRIYIDNTGIGIAGNDAQVTLVGRRMSSNTPEPYIQLITKVALAEVNRLLMQTTGRQLPTNERALIDQMRSRGYLIDESSQPTRIGGTQVRVVKIRADLLSNTVKSKAPKMIDQLRGAAPQLRQIEGGAAG